MARRSKRSLGIARIPLLCVGLLVATSNPGVDAFSSNLQHHSTRTRNSLVTTHLSTRNDVLEPSTKGSEATPLKGGQTSRATSIQKSVPITNALSSIAIGSEKSAEYQRGIATVVFITFIFSSNSPALHAAFSGSGPPPVLLLNAAVSCVALIGLVIGGQSLEDNTPLPSALDTSAADEQEGLATQGGIELGLWKMLGTTANLYGLAMTTAGHGALLIQLTTLIVPVVQGIQGVPIPRRIQFSVLLALAGVVSFTQDPTGTPSATGDALCVLAAIFYATYDLRLFAWGKRVAPRQLITTKIGTQAILSLALLAALDLSSATEYLSSGPNWSTVVPLVLWSGVAVNALAPFLQVGGQQAVGPTRCQTIYASQPLWAAMMSFFFLGEQIGVQGLVGGSAFLVALFLAATADAPDPNCEQEQCEI
ncbi:unnamed protein product [Cylindrotheca closterium]|uniref:EamA domain-containing protein n=1 Tax=Cylindrotheca closterium TaxID=2856 RepID=A0AAD2CFZ4_9STRA|nr:unnamed protein product [Cylindrotheca closterium]